MMNSNKAIKYLGLGLAIFLIVAILVGISYSLFSVTKIFIPKTEKEVADKNITKKFSNINSMDISLGATKLNIIEGNNFLIETNNKYIKIEEKNNKLILKENNHLKNIQKLELKITIPKDKILDNISLKSGAGSIKIDKIKANYFNFELGAGKTVIDDINVLKKANISLGAGSFTIKNGSFNDLDYKGSIGKSSITAYLNGDTSVSGGIGKFELQVLNPKKLYIIEVEKGIGTIKIDNENYGNGVMGTGEHRIKVASGIGKIDISFAS